MKKIVAIVLAALMLVSMTACGSAEKKDDGKYTIGICQLIQHDALDAATKGFKQAVIDQLGAENVTFDEQNASGDSNTRSTSSATKVLTMVEQVLECIR